MVDVVGRVCMDQCMLQLDSVPDAVVGDEVVLLGQQGEHAITANDLSVPDAVVGDEVVLLGQQGEHTITANDLASRWGTINYEVVCGLADRLPRLYKGS